MSPEAYVDASRNLRAQETKKQEALNRQFRQSLGNRERNFGKGWFSVEGGRITYTLPIQPSPPDPR